MDQNDIIKELLALSKVHFKATLEEDWEIWERTVQKKENLYRKLHQGGRRRIGQREKEQLQAISTLEVRTKEELLKKKDQIREAILQMKMTQKGLKGYQEGIRKSSRPHLSIKC